MSLKAMHESRRNSLESSQNNPEPVILPENLLKRAEEALKVLQLEQEQRIQAEQRANSEAEKNKTLQRLLTELSATSDSEMPTKLIERLKEQEKLLSNEQEQNRQLKKQLKEEEETATAAKKAKDERISQLEANISELQRRLKFEKFDKKAYLQGLESREQALKDGQETLKADRADFNSRVQSKAQEIEQDTIADYEAKKARCETEKVQLIKQQQAVEAERQEWLSSEKEKIDTEVTRQVTEHKAELDEQTAQERAEHDKQHDKRQKELESNWKSRNTALTTKFVTISGLTVSVGLISGIVAIISTVIAFVHGLLPFIIEDGKEIGNWIRNDWNAIFGQAFVFPNSLLPIIQLALPLIFLIIVGIWTALDFDERKWVVFADNVSIIFIGTGIGISAVFGKQLSELGLNTVMFPIFVYFSYVLIRWLWEIKAIQGLFNGVKRLIDRWNKLETNEKGGNAIIGLVIIGVILMIWLWIKG